MKQRKKEYIQLLKDIYGDNVVSKSIVDTSDGLKIDKESKYFKMSRYPTNQGCSECSNYLRGSFRKVKRDLPSWGGWLNFSSQVVRKYFVFGEDPRPEKILGTAYNLGIEKWEELINDNTTQKYGGLWWYLSKVIDNCKESDFYCSDSAKCGLKASIKGKKLHERWEICEKKFLSKEIRLINPELIIAQGSTASSALENIGDKEPKHIKNLSENDSLCKAGFSKDVFKDMECGILDVEGCQYRYLCIPHVGLLKFFYKGMKEPYLQILRQYIERVRLSYIEKP